MKGLCDCYFFRLVVFCLYFISSFSLFIFLSQFPSPYPVIQTVSYEPTPISPAPLPSAYTSSAPPMPSPYYSPAPHRPSLLLAPMPSLPSVPTLGTPQTPVSSLPQQVPEAAVVVLPFTAATTPRMPQQQGCPSISHPNLPSLHPTHTLPPLSQVQPTLYSAPHPEQDLTEQAVQVNIPLSSHWNGYPVFWVWTVQDMHLVDVVVNNVCAS